MVCRLDLALHVFYQPLSHATIEMGEKAEHGQRQDGNRFKPPLSVSVHFMGIGHQQRVRRNGDCVTDLRRKHDIIRVMEEYCRDCRVLARLPVRQYLLAPANLRLAGLLLGILLSLPPVLPCSPVVADVHCCV